MFKKYYRDILILAGVAFAILYFFDPKVEEVEVPVNIEVPVPVIDKRFDTVYTPKPVYIKDTIVKDIDSLYYKKYLSLVNDSLRRDSLFKESIKINKYKEKVEDDTISINLNVTVRGELLNYQLGYKTKPYTISLDTVVKFKNPTRAKLFGGMGVRLPINRRVLENKPTVFGGLYLKTKGDNLVILEVDPDRVSVGYTWKF